MASGTIQQVINNTGTGYCKTPDGTLIQWGLVTIEANKMSKSISFPVSFLNASYGFSATANYSQVPDVIITMAARATGSISVYRQASQTYDQPVAWLAIGRWK